MIKRLGAVLLALCVWSYADAAIVTKWLKAGAMTTLLNTELNSIGSNSCISAAAGPFDFSLGQANRDAYLFCTIEGTFTFAANPAANTAVSVWFLEAPDGTNYATTPACATPHVRPSVVLPVLSTATATRVTQDVLCPKGLTKIWAKNDGTGQALNAGGVNFIKVLPYTPQGIAQ